MKAKAEDMPSHNHQVALDLAAKDVRVFPCHPDNGPPGPDGNPQWRAKSPMPRIKWKEGATTNASIIDEWWSATPDALVGMPLAPRNLVVLDPDQHPGGPDGMAAFDALAVKHPELLGGPCVQTPQGRHYIYLQPKGKQRLGNSEGNLPPGINVRGDGGYVIAPGSRLPDGRMWTLHVKGRPFPLPKAVAALILGGDAADEPGEATGERSERETAYGKAALENACEKVRKAEQGRRNHTLNVQALKMGHLIPHILDEDVVIEALEEAAEQAGLDDAEIGPTIRSGLAKGKAEPHDPFDVANEFWDAGEEDESETSTEHPQQGGKGPRIWTGAELWDIPPVTYLVDGMIPRASVGLMIGDSQTFKSFLALDLALTIAQGKPAWHGHDIDAPDDAIVLYIAGEGGVEGISQRRRGWAERYGLDRKTMRDRFRLITHGVNLTDPSSLKALVTAVKEQLAADQGKLVLIVIDTMNTVAAGAEENSTKEMGALHNTCVRLATLFDTAVMGVHHTNKQGKTRGSILLTQNMDFWFFLKRRVFSSMKTELEVGKLKDATAGRKEKYEMQIVGLDDGTTTLVPIRIGAEEDEISVGGRPSPRTDAIKELLQGVADGYTVTEIYALLNITDMKERQAIRQCLLRGKRHKWFRHWKGKWSVTDDGGFFD